MGILDFKNEQFYLDGKPFRIISGAMHYFRIPREYWHDRLLKLKECGFNTVETYTCWNLHERKEGVFDFSGNLDIVSYIEEATALGLNIILRPGPYICAEWEHGGLPSWLLTYGDMELRCCDEVFLSKVRRYYGELLPRIRPYLSTNGGNIFMLQIENEYGSYGNDKRYMQAVLDIYRENGMDCLLFTSDGPTLTMLSGGSIDGYLCVGNFGSKPKENYETMKSFRRNQPFMCGEYWCGWFDHWGEEHHVRPYEEIVSDVADFMEMGASFNFYMFCGGTNFGFMNGANYGGKYEPTVTSYDYNAPLSESGDRTPTYYAIRDTIAKYTDVPPLTATDSEKAEYGEFTLTESAELFDSLDHITTPVPVVSPKYMEDIGQDLGYTLYRTTLTGPVDGWELTFDSVHDRAQVFVNGEYKATAERWRKDSYESKVWIPLASGESASLDILCENMGRVNYGNKIRDRKGIRGVRFGQQYHFGWEMLPLTMDDLSAVPFKEGESANVPAFFRGYLNIDDDPCDTFIRPEGFTKGFITVNGVNIGRYNNPAGPQKTLYIPAPFLKQGANEIIIFETDSVSSPSVYFTSAPDLG
ncbi:MAG: beta-galactosidase [Clostridia bacterium]|nr:beta-galactosidase [Clostridia bacterium]